VNHRHLLPEEIDLLVDQEVGFGVSPLKAHVRDCADCSAKLEEARFVVNAIEHLPHFAPSHNFVDNVMAQVPVFVPWHVAARDTVRQWLPQSRPARYAVVGAATSVTSLITLAVLWITTQTDALVLATGMAGDRLRELITQVGRGAIATVFGEQVFAAVQQMGTIGIVIALLGFIGAAGGTLAGLRAIAAASSRRRG
jgi:hypothetical protein